SYSRSASTSLIPLILVQFVESVIVSRALKFVLQIIILMIVLSSTDTLKEDSILQHRSFVHPSEMLSVSARCLGILLAKETLRSHLKICQFPNRTISIPNDSEVRNVALTMVPIRIGFVTTITSKET
ncbi:hypothetical protein PMAYCL1PPCAC_14248, partial [Pristionchus mayeri]